MPLFQRPKYQLAMRDAPSRLFGPRDPVDVPEMPVPEPVEEPVEPEPIAAEPKEGFGQKIGRIFGVTQPKPELDEYGLRKPAMEKEGIGSKALSYLLPLAVGAIGGVPFHGLAAAHTGDRARQLERQKLFAEEQDAYNENFQKMVEPPEKSSQQKGFEFLEGLPGDKRDDFLNYIAASSGVTYGEPGTEDGAPPKRTVNPPQPRQESNDDRYIRLTNTLAEKGTGALSVGDKEWLLQERRTRNKAGGKKAGSSLLGQFEGK